MRDLEGGLNETDRGLKVNELQSGVPSIDELKALALTTQEKQWEYGVSIYNLKDEDRKHLVVKGKTASIFEPDIPLELKKKVKGGVFIHSHPVFPEQEVEDGRSLHVLPSGHGAFSGDFAASMWSKVVGGYLNIASKYGLTVNIGVEGLPREEDLTRNLRAKLKVGELSSESVWKVLSGERGGRSFNQDEFPRAVDDKFSIEDDVVLLSHTEKNIGVKYFLHLSWDKLKELEADFGGLDNLFFGDGLDKLTNKLDIKVPHEKNVEIPTWKFYEMPKGRNGEIKED